MHVEPPLPGMEELSRLLRYGEQRARDLGIEVEDVAGLVDEYRAEVAYGRRPDSVDRSRSGSC